MKDCVLRCDDPSCPDCAPGWSPPPAFVMVSSPAPVAIEVAVEGRVETTRTADEVLAALRRVIAGAL